MSEITKATSDSILGVIRK